MAGQSIDGQSVLITGASSGIGYETARAFAANGADLTVTARRKDRLEKLATQLEDRHDITCLVQNTDVTDETAVAALVERAVNHHGGLDTVVNSAGIGREQIPIEEMSTDHYRSLMDVNVDGLFFLAREIIPHLRESSGTFVILGSGAGLYPIQSQPIYAASKWWTRGFALSLAGTMEREGIAVTLVNPSEVRTAITAPSGQSRADQHDRDEVIEPGEVADAIVFAAEQDPPTAITQLDIHRRDLLGFF